MRFFTILKEGSVSAGTRRIEGVAGASAMDYLKGEEERVRSLAGRLQVPPEELERKVESMLRTERELRAELAVLKDKLLSGGSMSAEKQERELPGGGKLVAQRLEGADIKSLRSLSDQTRQRVGPGAIFLASFDGDKVSFVVSLSPDLVGRGWSAVSSARELAVELQGKAGGRPDFAQGGGRKTKDFGAMLDDMPASWPGPDSRPSLARLALFS